MSDRKYRHRGYMDNNSEPQRSKPQSQQGPRQAPRDREGPRSPKMMAFGEAVNVTLGLPIIRTSVDHGTAFDIAGRNMADHGSLVEAIKLAARLIIAERST